MKRILHWHAGGGRPGRSFFQRQTPIQNFCRWHRLGDWLDIAQSTDLRFQYYDGPPLGRQDQSQKKNRPGRRLLEHLVTANLMLDTTEAAGMWLISLDLSKAFDMGNPQQPWIVRSNVVGFATLFLWPDAAGDKDVY